MDAQPQAATDDAMAKVGRDTVRHFLQNFHHAGPGGLMQFVSGVEAAATYFMGLSEVGHEATEAAKFEANAKWLEITGNAMLEAAAAIRLRTAPPATDTPQ